MRRKSGFTLLEIIIVIIIVGILAGLSLPRIFKTVEYSRGMEALANLGTIRQAMQRCYIFGNTYANCTLFTNLDVDNPNSTATRLFDYTIAVVPPTQYTLTATRQPASAPPGTISITQDGVRSGTGTFINIQ